MELICDSVWPELIDNWEGNPRYIAVAYFSNDDDLSFDENDLLIIDASDGAIKSGQTDAKVLESAFESGALIYSCPNLHAKVYVLGTKVLIGSANASQSSRNNLIECMVSSSDPHLITESIKFVQALSEISEPVTQDFIDRILQLEVKRNISNRGDRVPLYISPSRCWLLGLHPEDYPGNEEEMDEQNKDVQEHLANEDEEVDWFWWPINKSKFVRDAKVGDLFIDIWRPNRKDNNTDTVLVYRHARICKITKEPDVNAKVFHFAMPVDAEESSISWDDFCKLAANAGLNGKLSINSCKEIPRKQSKVLHELWPE